MNKKYSKNHNLKTNRYIFNHVLKIKLARILWQKDTSLFPLFLKKCKKNIMTHQEFWEQKNVSILKTKEPSEFAQKYKPSQSSLKRILENCHCRRQETFWIHNHYFLFFKFFFLSEVFLNNVFIIICSKKIGPTCQNETCRFFRNFTGFFFLPFRFGISFWVISVLVFLRVGMDWEEVAYLI